MLQTVRVEKGEGKKWYYLSSPPISFLNYGFKVIQKSAFFTNFYRLQQGI